MPIIEVAFSHLDKRFGDPLNGGENDHQPKHRRKQCLFKPRKAEVGDKYSSENMQKSTH